MRLKSIIHATLAVAAAGALPGVWPGVAVAQERVRASRAMIDLYAAYLRAVS